jgi:hypothetical protein
MRTNNWQADRGGHQGTGEEDARKGLALIALRTDGQPARGYPAVHFSVGLEQVIELSNGFKIERPWPRDGNRDTEV